MNEKTQNILIVDDTPENLVILERVLRRVPAHIIQASSGQEALVAALNNNLALAILDVQMPGMDGYELATLLREHENLKTLPIIFVSAVYSDEQHVFRAYEAGAVDFMVKPFDSAQLILKVKIFLELNKANQELHSKVVELALSESRFQTLVRTIPDTVFRIDTKGNIVFINTAIERFGYSPEELLEKPFEILVHPEDVKSKLYTCYTHMGIEGTSSEKDGQHNQSGVQTIELRLLTKPVMSEEEETSGARNTCEGRHVVDTEITCSPIMNYYSDGGDAKLLGTVGLIRDITERKEIEKELKLYREHLENLVDERTKKLQIEMEERIKSEQKQQQLESMLMQQQRLESIGTLAGGVAHEINNPINGIMNYAQLIVDEGGSEETVQFSNAIIEETERVAKIVQNLLQFARSDQGIGMGKASPIEMVEYVVSLVKTIMRHDQICLILDDAMKNMPEITCQSNEIEQVLMNLMTNACDSLNTRYSGYDENKVIRVSVDTGTLHGTASVVFCVEDHGMGIAEDHLQHIFEPFFTTKDRTKGTGLGLSISHGIVKKHNGELRVETEYGNYTRFLLELPIEQED